MRTSMILLLAVMLRADSSFALLLRNGRLGDRAREDRDPYRSISNAREISLSKRRRLAGRSPDVGNKGIQ